MADAYTATTTSNLDQTAYNLAVDYALRSRLHFDAVADVQPTAQAMPGAAVIFTIENDLSIASTALAQSTDVDAVTNTETQVTLTLVEQGNAMITTAKLRGTSFVPFDPIVANLIAYNAAITMDELACIALRGGTNVLYATGGATDPTGRTTVESSDTIVAPDIGKALARLVANNVVDIDGDYACFIHPDVEFDLKEDTGASGWLNPANYSAPEQRWNGEIGRFNGFRFVRTPRAPIFADAGSSTTLTDVYATICMGRQALAKAYSYTDGNGATPRVIPGPVTDKLRRFQPMGWYWLGAYGRYREASLYRIESASSIGAN